jgi:hypothetical protein
MPKASKNTQQPAASQYGSGYGGQNFLEDLETPSGNLVQVKRVGIKGLIKAGVLESVDTLTALVTSETIPKAEGRRTISAEEVVNDPKKLDDMLEMVDKIVSTVVNQPKFAPRPAPDEEGNTVYEPGVAYLDLVPIEDKMFIVNYVVGGTADLEGFREESKAALGGGITI